MAVKKPEINYTPEELSEIDRIINVITEADDIHVEKPVAAQTVKNIPKKTDDQDINDFDIEDTDIKLDSDIEDIDINLEPDIEDIDINLDSDIEDMNMNLDSDIEDITDSIADEDITYLEDSDLSLVEEEDGIALDEKFDDEKFDDGEFEEGKFEEEIQLPDIKEESTFALEEVDDLSIPDIDEISMRDGSDIPEAEIDDISSIDLGGLDLSDEPKNEYNEYNEIDQIDDIPDSLTDLGDIETVTETTETSPLDELDSFDDFADIDSISDAFAETPSVKRESIDDDFIDEDRHDDEALTIEPLDDDIIDRHDDNKSSRDKDSQGISPEISLNDIDIARLKKAITHFNPEVREVIRDTVVNDMLPPSSMKKLVDMIITGKSEDSIRKFLEKKLKTKIAILDEAPSKRRVITSRPEYSRAGRERQKKLFLLTSALGLTAILSFLITIISYQFIYKPYMAKKLIKDGVALILKSSEEGERFDRKKNYGEAERLFREVDEKYKKDYLYGYNEYGRAYLWNKDYRESIEKLNGAYIIDKNHIDKITLNNLGYFYAKT
ncbi:MAG: hypothetical protein FWH53_10055, partial [Leptospirales bacterium]|nr:hypothetical protein [Leptospirales bacterium]